MLTVRTLYLMACIYFVAGINHFLNPHSYMKIMPSWLPFSEELIFVSGAIEIVCALLLLPSFSRKLAAWSIIVLLIAIFPANIQMSINYYEENNPYFLFTLLRLPLQFLLIWWAYQYTKPAATKHASKQI
jgi:uncharacterized membrane protein